MRKTRVWARLLGLGAAKTEDVVLDGDLLVVHVAAIRGFELEGMPPVNAWSPSLGEVKSCRLAVRQASR